MYKALSPGAIGVSAPTMETRVALARRHGFDGVEVDAEEVRRRLADVPAILGDVKPAGFGLPVDWRGDEGPWQQGLANLDEQSKACAGIGCRRTFTWILPGSNDRDMESNRRFHVERFKPIAAVLASHGCFLGLEFIGPKTLRDQFVHPFIYQMQDMLSMAREIGPNVGLLLDCWHWYTSGGTIEELRTLTADDVVYVHVNDAPAGVPLDRQVDNVRCLPGETGVIPIGEFLGVLRDIGYAGPVVPEPFKKELSDLPNDEARMEAVSYGMERIFAQVRPQQ